ncbi:MAG: tRNA pseudouridine(55) synthase TruB [Alphaproteobacteria bacterium]|nr:tRNA pseudouridine(55) synthase TruB [Alphaproteobacteria bacterium]
MSEKKDITGWLVLDKPLGMSSAQAVGKVKHLLHPQKIGHAGTLDPLASGVLPLALGKATRTVSYVMDGHKKYRFEITFGKATTTDDAEGEIIKTSSKLPTEEEIRQILPQFTGKIKQTPPIYSALKVNGKRAYALARQGEEFHLSEREIEIFVLNFIEKSAIDKAILDVECSKGTYVRSLGRDIAEKLGSVGHISYLRRTKSGKFEEKDAISLEKLEKIIYGKNQEQFLIPIETVLSDILELAVSRKEALALSQGQVLKNRSNLKNGFYKAIFEGMLIAFVDVDTDFVRPTKVFKQNF